MNVNGIYFPPIQDVLNRILYIKLGKTSIALNTFSLTGYEIIFSLHKWLSFLCRTFELIYLFYTKY